MMSCEGLSSFSYRVTNPAHTHTHTPAHRLRRRAQKHPFRGLITPGALVAFRRAHHRPGRQPTTARHPPTPAHRRHGDLTAPHLRPQPAPPPDPALLTAHLMHTPAQAHTHPLMNRRTASEVPLPRPGT